MADFALLGEAVYRAHGRPEGAFLADYSEKRKDSVHRTIEGHPVAAALLAWLEDHPAGYEGAASGLFPQLEGRKQDSDGWPRSVKGFGDALRRISPSFRLIGWEIRYLGHKRDGHHWRVVRGKTHTPSYENSKDNGHDGHTVTDPPVNRDRVTNVTVPPGVSRGEAIYRQSVRVEL
jgi:hypothetical protein